PVGRVRASVAVARSPAESRLPAARATVSPSRALGAGARRRARAFVAGWRPLRSREGSPRPGVLDCMRLRRGLGLTAAAALGAAVAVLPAVASSETPATVEAENLGLY